MAYVNLIMLFMSLSMIFYYARFKYFLKAFFFGASTGILSLGITLIFFPDMFSFNFFTIITSIFAGAPGIILEILIKQFLL